MKSCEYFEFLISRMIDEDLSASEREELLRHIDACPECSALYGAFASVSRTIADDLVDPPESLSINVMAHIRRRNIRKVNKPRIPGYWKGIAVSAACLAVILFAAFGGQSKLSSASDTAAIFGGSVHTGTETTGSTPADAGVYERIIEAAPVEAEESTLAPPSAEPTPQQSNVPSAAVILQNEQPEAEPETATAPAQASIQAAAVPTPYEPPIPEITLAGSAKGSEITTETHADSAEINTVLAMPEPVAADVLPSETVICDTVVRDELMKLLSGKKADLPSVLEKPKYILRYCDDTGVELIINIYMLEDEVFYHSCSAQTAENESVFYHAACTAADLESFMQTNALF